MKIYFDVSVTFRNGLNTGIQRVVRKLVSNDFNNEMTLIIGDARQPDVFRLITKDEFLTTRVTEVSNLQKSIFFAGKTLHKLRFLMPVVNHLPKATVIREVIKERISPNYRVDKEIQKRNVMKITKNDVYVTFDAFWNSENDLSRIVYAKQKGAKVIILVHDVLPITHPQFFEKSNIKNFNQNFTKGVEQADLIFFTSKHVLQSFKNCFPTLNLNSVLIPLGSDYDDSSFFSGARKSQSHMLMLGTLEPRKNYLEILKWYRKTDVANTLVIVGRRGWKSAKVRRMIRKVRRKGKDLLWIQDVSDKELSALIADAAIGICASFEEGYGLPLREFLSKHLHVVASDIAVFREINCSAVTYFTIGDWLSLENAIKTALSECDEEFTVHLDQWIDTYKVFLSSVKSL
jgi:hypothetical protein